MPWFILCYFQECKSIANNDLMVCSLDETMNTFLETCNDTEMNSTFNFSLEEAYSILSEHKREARIFDQSTEVNIFFFFFTNLML